MTDFLVTSQNHASLPLSSGNEWQNGENEREINLKDALVSLLTNGEEINANLASSKDEPVSQRSLDLLVWIMNLELRLSPYSDPA